MVLKLVVFIQPSVFVRCYEPAKQTDSFIFKRRWCFLHIHNQVVFYDARTLQAEALLQRLLENKIPSLTIHEELWKLGAFNKIHSLVIRKVVGSKSSTLLSNT